MRKNSKLQKLAFDPSSSFTVNGESYLVSTLKKNSFLIILKLQTVGAANDPGVCSDCLGPKKTKYSSSSKIYKCCQAHIMLSLRGGEMGWQLVIFSFGDIMQLMRFARQQLNI